jgi:hypothetical protein
LSTRTRIIVTGVLLCLALGATIFCAVQTVRAIQRFQLTRTLTAAGDVSTIRPWMTIPYISRVYHVPEGYLYESLNITYPQPVYRTSLRSLAVRYNRSLDGLISEIQTAIKTYRKQHPPHRSFTNLHTNELLAWERRKT